MTRYTTWCPYQGYDYRGQRFRSRYRYGFGKDCVGSLCTNHKQPRERRLRERRSPGIEFGLDAVCLWAGSQDWKCWLAGMELASGVENG
ncbi:hypothetical protein VTG60DRAFT_3956 [Thermothelomyces hinnuleus]